MGRTGTATETIKWSEFLHFTPRQAEASAAVANHDYILYGGTRGPGKSYWLRHVLVWLMAEWFRLGIAGVRTALFCESYPVLRDRQISKIKQEFPLWLGELKDTQEEGLGFYLTEALGGGVMHLRNLDDPEKYKGAEWACIGVDQLEQIPLETFNILRGSKRWPGIEHTKFLSTGNPGGVGHAWNVAYFIERNYPLELQPLADRFTFIRAKPEDNPYLSDEYWAELKSLPDKLRRAWLEGDYYVFAGQAFSIWSERHIIQPRIFPPNWSKWRAVDWGLAAPFCCLWFTRDPDIGRVYLYREVYERGLSDTQQAKMILENTPPGETINLTYADPSLWSRKTMGNLISTTADEYTKAGVYLTKGDNDRMSGKRKVDRLLQNIPDGLPGLQVVNTCSNFIRTFPYLISDENNIEDVDTNQEDHAYDALKYGLTNTHSEVKQKPQQNPWLQVNHF